MAQDVKEDSVIKRCKRRTTLVDKRPTILISSKPDRGLHQGVLLENAKHRYGKKMPFLTNSLRDSVSQKKLTQLPKCSSQRLYLFSPSERSKTMSSLQAAQFINMTSTHSPNSFLTRPLGKAAQIRAPRQSRAKGKVSQDAPREGQPKAP